MDYSNLIKILEQCEQLFDEALEIEHNITDLYKLTSKFIGLTDMKSYMESYTNMMQVYKHIVNLITLLENITLDSFSTNISSITAQDYSVQSVKLTKKLKEILPNIDPSSKQKTYMEALILLIDGENLEEFSALFNEDNIDLYVFVLKNLLDIKPELLQAIMLLTDDNKRQVLMHPYNLPYKFNRNLNVPLRNFGMTPHVVGTLEEVLTTIKPLRNISIEKLAKDLNITFYLLTVISTTGVIYNYDDLYKLRRNPNQGLDEKFVVATENITHITNKTYKYTFHTYGPVDANACYILDTYDEIQYRLLCPWPKTEKSTSFKVPKSRIRNFIAFYTGEYTDCISGYNRIHQEMIVKKLRMPIAIDRLFDVKWSDAPKLKNEIMYSLKIATVEQLRTKAVNDIITIIIKNIKSYTDLDVDSDVLISFLAELDILRKAFTRAIYNRLSETPTLQNSEIDQFVRQILDENITVHKNIYGYLIHKHQIRQASN